MRDDRLRKSIHNMWSMTRRAGDYLGCLAALNTFLMSRGTFPSRKTLHAQR